jgi:hypothetical protein
MKTPATHVQTNPAPQDSLLATVDARARRRACDIPEQTIDRFVALRWLAWNGGSLRLTEAGEAMVATMQAAMPGEQRLAA